MRPVIGYEPVDVSQIPPRPRTYGLKGAEAISEVWKEMSRESRQKPAAAGA